MPDSAGAKTTRFVYLATAISALGGLLFGYDVGVISGAILFIQKAFSLPPGIEEIVVSSVLLGSLAGALIGGSLADRLGRRRLLIVTAVVFGCGAIGAALSPGTAWLIVARIVAGAAIGIASFVAPLYISEIAPVAIRGKLVSVNQVALTSGIVISYGIDYAFAGSGAWRWMFAMAVVPAAAFGIGLCFIPDSPRWLAARGKMEQARAVLARIRSPQEVERELGEIRQSVANQKGHWSELLSPLLRPAMIVGVGLAVAQQITGINTVIYYAPTIFKFAGLSSSSVAILASVGVGVVNVVFTVVAMQLIDRVGRRPLLLVSLAGIGSASQRNHEFLRKLGVDQVVEYPEERFEEWVEPVDVVFDTVGGDTQDRSWKVLKRGGILVSIASPPSAETAEEHGVRQAFVMSEANGAQLAEIAKLVVTEKLKAIVETILPLSDATRGQELSERGHVRGKIVLRVIEP